MNTLLLLLLFPGLVQEGNREETDRLFRNATIVQLMAEKGEKIHAGPLTVFIDPETHKPVKSVVADPAKNLLIPAIQKRAGGKKSAGIYLVRPVSGRASKAVFRSIGGEMHVVVPDQLGSIPIRERTFWIKGRKAGRRFVRQVGYYEVIAYTSRDAFLRGTVSLDRIDGVGWKDRGSNTETEVTAGGIDIEVQNPPPTKRGSPYEIKGTVTVTGEPEGKLVLWIAYSDGSPKKRRHEIDPGKKKGKKKKKDDDRPEDGRQDAVDHGFEFIVIAKGGPTERNLVKMARINDAEADFSGSGSPEIGGWNPVQQFSGTVQGTAGGFAPFDDGSGADTGGNLFRQGVVSIGAAATGLVPAIFSYLDSKTGEKRESTRSAVVVNEADARELVRVKVFFDELPPIDPEEGEKAKAREILSGLEFAVPGKKENDR